MFYSRLFASIRGSRVSFEKFCLIAPARLRLICVVACPMKKGMYWIFWIPVATLALVFLLTTNALVREKDVVSVARRTVSITTRDGERLAAELFQPREKPIRKYPGVVLLSPFLESRQTYIKIDSAIAQAGMVVLSVDVRESGESARHKTMNLSSPRKLDLDANAALRFLAKDPLTDSTRLAILGTALTARAAVLGAGENKNVRALVLVSALLDSAALDLIKKTPSRPLLLLCSFEDAVAGPPSRSLYESSKNPYNQFHAYLNAGEGSEIWWSPARGEMALLIIDWLAKQLKR